MIIVIDKPTGLTSHTIVAQIKKRLNLRVGHTGTLDPLATGVLPLVCGKATKLSQYLMGSDKSYHAWIRLGISTTTMDAEGEIVEEKPVSVDKEQLEEAMRLQRGKIMQIPPMYSAKKVNGKKLYELARAGIEIAREAKCVNVSQFECVAFSEHEIQVIVTCSAGTYIRVMANELGKALGCGAHLKALRRTQAGAFSLADAVPLHVLSDEKQSLEPWSLPLNRALSTLKRVHLGPVYAHRLKNGMKIKKAQLKPCKWDPFATQEALTLYDERKQLIGIARAQIKSTELDSLPEDALVFTVEQCFAVPSVFQSHFSEKENHAHL
jgi:tRNA pseudouridine55 synthase